MADEKASGAPYREGVPDLVAYVLSALLLIGLGIWLGSPILNWIIGPGLAIAFVVLLTPVCRRLHARWTRPR
jgi:Ca2+/Na+ antiporter